jgi:hypothetical protein
MNIYFVKLDCAEEKLLFSGKSASDAALNAINYAADQYGLEGEYDCESVELVGLLANGPEE